MKTRDIHKYFVLIDQSEAYLEGMKTWNVTMANIPKFMSEAYLEGMKTALPDIVLFGTAPRPKPTSKE